MKKICFIVPYFGKLPNYFSVWLISCKYNESIDWMLFTNDKADYDYPPNVHVHYCSFRDIQEMIRNKYEFQVSIETPYKLCDYKIAYGDIFQSYLIDYDYWGFCDIDLIWGDIRKFYNEDLLGKYDKIGNQGHATIFRNNKLVNNRYKVSIGPQGYKEAFSSPEIMCTDVKLIKEIYDGLHIPVYDETMYAGLEKYEPAFFLQAKPREEAWKNRRQVFVWDKGSLTRYYLNRYNVLESEEYLYIHFFCRPMKNKISEMSRILIYPDVYMTYEDEITPEVVDKYGKKCKLAYFYRVYKQNKNRLSLKKIISYFSIKLKYELKKREL